VHSECSAGAVAVVQVKRRGFGVGGVFSEAYCLACTEFNWLFTLEVITVKPIIGGIITVNNLS